MKQELDDLLCQRYPLIFADRHRPVTESCMALGFMCGDGWFGLLDDLCRDLQSATDDDNAPQVVAVVVKEELGWLKFACRGLNAAQRDIISRAMARSGRICEQCGQPGQLLKRGVLLTRCADHAPAGAQPVAASVP